MSEKNINNQEGIEKERDLGRQEIEPIKTEVEEQAISETEKVRRKEELEKITQEAKVEEDTDEQIEQKKTFRQIVKSAREGFPIEDNKRIVQTVGERILDPKERVGVRKALEEALNVDPALFDELNDWCVEHYHELIEAGEIIELK